jgi:hypothetical protein
MNIEIRNGYTNSTHTSSSSFSYLLDIKSKSLLCYFIVNINNFKRSISINDQGT